MLQQRKQQQAPFHEIHCHWNEACKSDITFDRSEEFLESEELDCDSTNPHRDDVIELYLNQLQASSRQRRSRCCNENQFGESGKGENETTLQLDDDMDVYLSQLQCKNRHRRQQVKMVSGVSPPNNSSVRLASTPKSFRVSFRNLFSRKAAMRRSCSEQSMKSTGTASSTS